MVLTRRQQCYVVIGFLAVTYSVPLTQSIVEIARGQVPQFFDVFRQVPNRSSLRSYEKELEEQSIVARSVRPWIQYARFVLFRDAGEKVLVGREGWLFYRPDVRYLVEPLTPPAGEQSEDPFAAITLFRDQLRSRGIQLMVLPVPGKPSLYGEMLTTRLSGVEHVTSPTLTLISRLRRAGVEVFDLFELFGKTQISISTSVVSCSRHPLVGRSGGARCFRGGGPPRETGMGPTRLRSLRCPASYRLQAKRHRPNDARAADRSILSSGRNRDAPSAAIRRLGPSIATIRPRLCSCWEIASFESTRPTSPKQRASLLIWRGSCDSPYPR